MLTQKRQGLTTVVGAVIFTILSLLSMAAYAVETEVIGSQSVWRVWMANGTRVYKGPDSKTLAVVLGKGGATSYTPTNSFLSALPATDWNKPTFDDHQAARMEGAELFDHYGGLGKTITLYGGDGRWQAFPAVYYLRTRFGVSDPPKATDLKVTVEYLGGAVVCVNGVEVGRSHLPDGAIDPSTLASDYPVETYVTEDSETPLPVLGEDHTPLKPEPKWESRYQARVRTATFNVPANILVKGANTLTVELHRARVSGPTMGRAIWSHLAIRKVKLISDSGFGVISHAESLKGTRIWSAEQSEEITERPVPWSRLPGGFAVGGAGAAVSGISTANPYDPVSPIRVFVPRNGIGNGVTVLSDPDGLHTVSASVKDFTGPADAVLPAKSALVRFAVQDDGFHWCDTLLEKAPDGKKTLPVWIEVKAPKDQAPGWYVSELTIEANGKKFPVAVQVFVTGYVLPEPKDFRSIMGIMHSPDAALKISQAEPWSDAHFAVMAKSLEAAGQLGNDIMYVPVMIGDHMGHQVGLIRWTKTPTGLKPDFTAFEKYLDLYTKYCATPKAIILYIWSPDTVKELSDAYENRRVPTREAKPARPLQVTLWDPATGTNTPVAVPSFTEEGAEAIWKPMLDGVQAIVTKRGWSERIIMVGTGSDLRPSQKTGEILRKWAPYARWDIYSHWSAEAMHPEDNKGLSDAAPLKCFAIGGLETGVKEHPWFAAGWDEIGLQKVDYLNMPLHRSYSFDGSPPPMFRSLPVFNGRLARLGLDFWPGDTKYNNLIWGEYPIRLLARGPAGSVPTVRLQMMREGVQDFEPRLDILEVNAKLPKAQQKSIQSLFGDTYKNYRTAEELAGIKTEASWDTPPAP
ncbi:MAG: glycoside hydrolase domain-containing protein [Verrucomicrobiota bacterium]